MKAAAAAAAVTDLFAKTVDATVAAFVATATITPPTSIHPLLLRINTSTPLLVLLL